MRDKLSRKGGLFLCEKMTRADTRACQRRIGWLCVGMKKFTQKQYKKLFEIAGRTASVLPFASDTPAERQKRKEKATRQSWQGFECFCKIYFPHFFELGFCDAHREMWQRTQGNCNGITAITGFRRLGKTVLMGVAYNIWLIVLGEKYSVHVAADEGLAEERTMFIYSELTNNKRLLHDWTWLAIKGGEEKDFYLQNDSRVRARGISQAVRGTINPRTGKRPGLIICDDIDAEKNMGNFSIGKRKMEKINEEISGALCPGGRCLWLGNLTHPNYAISQFAELIKGEILAEERGARVDARKHFISGRKQLLRFALEDEKGRSVWEEQYPTQELGELRKQYGHTGYQREMLGKPVIEGNIFKNEWFKEYSRIDEKVKQVWMYADPAWGEKGCYKAIVSIAWTGSKFYLLHAWVRRTKNSVFFEVYTDIFAELDRRYGARFRAAIECNYGQERILADMDEWCGQNARPNISHLVKKIYNRENKNLRIERTETYIESGKLLFPNGQDMPTLKAQFLTYPDGEVDAPDAVAGCLERFGNYSKRKLRIRSYNA